MNRTITGGRYQLNLKRKKRQKLWCVLFSDGQCSHHERNQRTTSVRFNQQHTRKLTLQQNRACVCKEKAGWYLFLSLGTVADNIVNVRHSRVTTATICLQVVSYLLFCFFRSVVFMAQHIIGQDRCGRWHWQLFVGSPTTGFNPAFSGCFDSP